MKLKRLENVARLSVLANLRNGLLMSDMNENSALIELSFCFYTHQEFYVYFNIYCIMCFMSYEYTDDFLHHNMCISDYKPNVLLRHALYIS